MALRGGVLCAKSGLPNPLPSNRSRRNAGMRLVSSTTAADADRQKRPQNVEGEFFVDCRCIDCDTCRWMAPVSALIFLDLIPKLALDFTIITIHINSLCLQGIYHCGYHSERSYGATSYLITHPEGNILVDRSSSPDVSYRDDVGDHEKWSNRLKCDRILHSGDVRSCTLESNSFYPLLVSKHFSSFQ
ncbi:hypothetical protein B296_00038896 [Ensete ventricosum]|uniref:Metallo-beta-lactamase domain-containing protein n=1 Tax=Ensete ventricosum TaxID=4639 RepID=A0A426ZBN1_ENSVE|nr:hypothetical protein B296_00038896 [Ensete ventricosum]